MKIFCRWDHGLGNSCHRYGGLGKPGLFVGCSGSGDPKACCLQCDRHDPHCEFEHTILRRLNDEAVPKGTAAS